MKTISLAAAAPMVFLAACGTNADPQESVDAIRQTEQAQLESIASGDLVGIARLYADDAELVRPDGSVLDGGAAIANAYGDLLEDPNFALTTEPIDGWASASADLAVLTSRVQFTTTDPETGEPVTMPLYSQTTWTRQTGATWKIVSAFNVAAEDGAAPPEVAAPAETE